MRRMLIVDDEPDVCDCLGTFFESRGFLVTTAYSGEEALAHLQDLVFDVILLDIELPGVSGLEVLREAKKLHPKVRVVMVSGLDKEEVRKMCFHYGAYGFILKPFDFSEVTWAPVLEEVL